MGIVKNRCKNGDHYWVSAYVTPIYEKDIWLAMSRCARYPIRYRNAAQKCSTRGCAPLNHPYKN